LWFFEDNACETQYSKFQAALTFQTSARIRENAANLGVTRESNIKKQDFVGRIAIPVNYAAIIDVRMTLQRIN
jgi:hypothetical protein